MQVGEGLETARIAIEEASTSEAADRVAVVLMAGMRLPTAGGAGGGRRKATRQACRRRLLQRSSERAACTSAGRAARRQCRAAHLCVHGAL